MPTIIKSNYKNLLSSNIETTLNNYHIKGFVISNICNIKLLHTLFADLNKHLELITNYTLNVYNSNTIKELKNLGICRYTISPELNREIIHNLCNCTDLPNEIIVYGTLVLYGGNTPEITDSRIYSLNGETATGVMGVVAEENAPVEVYTLGGVKVGNSLEGLQKGIYVVKQGNKVVKVMK